MRLAASLLGTFAAEAGALKRKNINKKLVTREIRCLAFNFKVDWNCIVMMRLTEKLRVRNLLSAAAPLYAVNRYIRSANPSLEISR
jgi:hypothetical protein